MIEFVQLLKPSACRFMVDTVNLATERCSCVLASNLMLEFDYALA